MALPSAPDDGCPAERPPAPDRHAPTGSSIVSLTPEAHPHERPTIIGPARPAAPMDLAPGQRLGHFELLDAIGCGGMATVIKGRDLELGRIVALKLLPPETARDPEAVSRFKQEARAAAKLDHDNIARVYFCGEDRGQQFIAFEFVAGDNLRVVLDRVGKLSPAEAVCQMLNVAGGLKHAAERGVVHRDIKPGNIIITPEGPAKIVDMGLARHFDSGSVNAAATQSGVTLGTFDYISPEQALDPRRADVRSDIYSLGCTYYHALTGRPPVPEGTAARKLQSHQHESPIDPRDLNPAVPESLAAVLAKMMAKDPERRYQTADDLIADLHSVAVSCGYTMELPLPENLAPRSAPRLAEPNLRISTAWLLAVAAAIVAFAVIFAKPDRVDGLATPPWTESAVATKSLPLEALVNPPAVVPSGNAILTPAQLAEALKGETASIKLKPGATYDLTTLGDAIAFTGTNAILESEGGPGLPPVLRLRAGGEESPGIRSLTFRGCRAVTLRGLDLQIIDGGATEDTEANHSAIRFENVAKTTIQGCRIRSTGSHRIGLDIAGGGSNELAVQNSFFDIGSLGVACRLSPATRGEFHESAFFVQGVALQVDAGESDVPHGEIKLTQCTFLIEHGAAIRAEAGLALRIAAGFCLFGAAEKTPAAEPERSAACTVLRLDGTAAPETKFEGIANQPNGYFAVAALMLDGKNFSIKDCPATLYADTSARDLSRSPWAVSDPRPLVAGSDPPAAFRLALNDMRLRLPPASAAVILGAKTLGGSESRIYPGAWPPEKPQGAKAGPRERILWPEAEAEDAALRLYPTFASAFAALQPGETLSLAVNGAVPVPPLPEKSLKATIRAATGFKPVLTPEGTGFSLDAVIFRLADGELTFQNLEIVAKDRQAIVSVGGGATCTFQNCILTLLGKDDAPVAAAVIPDPAREMKSASSSDEPRVSFLNTILRGDGRAIWVQAARGFDASFDNSALALDDNLITLESAERTTHAEAPRAKVRLKRCTVVLNDSLVELKAARSNGGVPAFLSIEAENCLFSAADHRASPTPMILLDDAEPKAELAKYLTWSGRGSVFAFSESTAAVEWRTAGEAMANTWDWPQWLRFLRDEGRHLSRIRFARGSLKAKLATVEAADFAPSIANPMDAGVDVEKLSDPAKATASP